MGILGTLNKGRDSKEMIDYCHDRRDQNITYNSWKNISTADLKKEGLDYVSLI